MSRFFKSAAFPILIVVVLAFFAQKLISPGTQTAKPTYGDFITQLNARYVGFEIPNRFAIGYGLDHGELLRNLPYVASLAERP